MVKNNIIIFVGIPNIFIITKLSIPKLGSSLFLLSVVIIIRLLALMKIRANEMKALQ